MLFAINKSEKNIKKVIENLRLEDEIEMIFEFGENWKNVVSNSAKSSEIKIIVDELNNPVGLFGIKEIDKNTAEICLLATDKLKDNPISFLLNARKIVKNWLRKYKKLQNYIYKHNKSGIRWLKLLGFELKEFNQNKMYFFIGE